MWNLESFFGTSNIQSYILWGGVLPWDKELWACPLLGSLSIPPAVKVWCDQYFQGDAPPTFMHCRIWNCYLSMFRMWKCGIVLFIIVAHGLPHCSCRKYCVLFFVHVCVSPINIFMAQYIKLFIFYQFALLASFFVLLSYLYRLR